MCVTVLYGCTNVVIDCITKCKHRNTFKGCCLFSLRRFYGSLIREGTFFLGGGRAGASEGRVISESEHQTGRAIPHVSYSREGHTSFPEFFNENFWDVTFHFFLQMKFFFSPTLI